MSEGNPLQEQCGGRSLESVETSRLTDQNRNNSMPGGSAASNQVRLAGEVARAHGSELVRPRPQEPTRAHRNSNESYSNSLHLLLQQLQ